MGNDQRRLKVWLGIDVIKRKIINFLIFFNEGRTQTLNDAGGGGQNDPLVRRSPAISHRIIRVTKVVADHGFEFSG